MSCSARICSCAAVALVLLRLAAGWHFFMEGREKLSDPNWSSAGFLLQAKGPLAEFYHSRVPQVHGWRTHLATPPASDLSDDDRADAIREWQTAYDQRKAEALEEGQPEPFEVQPHQPYSAWATQIAADWQATLDRYVQLPILTDDDKDQARAALVARRAELIEYLQGIAPEIADFHVELARVRDMAKRNEADGVPYYGGRIQSLENEAMRMPQPWLADVNAIEQAYFDDLRDIHRAAEQAATEAEEAEDEGDNDDANVVASPPEASGNGQPAVGEAVDEDQQDSDESDGVSESADQEGMPPAPVEEEPAEEEPAEEEPAEEEPAEEDTADAPSEEVSDEADGEGASNEPEVADAEENAGSDETEQGDEAEGSDEDVMTLEEVFVDDKAARLALVDEIVTWLTLGVGALLIVGLFVPVAGFAGAAFLAAVISTQPPWVPGAEETYYQFIEMFGLLVLACTCAGRWAGLDYFFTLIFTGGRSQ